MKKAEFLEIVADLYIQGHNASEIVRILSEKCPNCHIPSERTIRRWIAQNREQWDLRRKQKEILKIEKAHEEKKTLEEKIQLEIDKAEALDYQDLCEIQEKYKKIALEGYKPRAVEVVIQCIKLKREIREGLKPEEENKIVITFEGAPEKSTEVIYED